MRLALFTVTQHTGGRATTRMVAAPTARAALDLAQGAHGPALGFTGPERGWLGAPRQGVYHVVGTWMIRRLPGAYVESGS